VSREQPSSIAITNALVVEPKRVIEGGSVGIRDGFIVEVSDAERPRDDYETVIDVNGAYVMPGIIDLHNDSLEVEINPRPETNLSIDFALANLERRLIFSGVTTEFHAIAFMNRASGRRTSQGAAERSAFLAERGAAVGGLIDSQVLHRLDVWSPDSLDLIFESLGRLPVRYVSINDHTPGQGQYRDLDGFKQRMAAWAERRGDVADAAAEIERRISERASDSETVPAVYQRILTERERLGFAIASHDDDSPEKVEALYELGARITEFPVDVASARKARELGMTIVVGAPNIVRGGSSSGNQSAVELFELGLADVICADYHAPSLLVSAFALADAGVAALPTAIAALTRNAASAVGLDDRGAIEPGMRADLIVVRRPGRGLPAVERVFCRGVERLSLRSPETVGAPA
jgi:alpha-D-ribose 1-methylphosphonate 5-triphosphate diphosphatase